MKTKLFSMLFVAALSLSMGLSPAIAIVPPPLPTLTYTGDLFVPACNVCLEATFDNGDGDVEGYPVIFGLCKRGVGCVEFDPVLTDADGVATLCIGPVPPGEYTAGAKINADGLRVKVQSVLYVYEARATGGGQILAENGDKKKDWFKISFGLGAYKIGEDDYVLDSCEITFHNVSVNWLDKHKFVATEIRQMGCRPLPPDGTGIRLRVNGWLEDEDGVYIDDYSMEIQLQDSGEPAWEDNLHFELRHDGSTVYDSHKSGDFDDGFDGVRTLLANGNIQVECLRCGPG